LGKDAFHGLTDKIRAVQAGCDDGYQGSGHLKSSK
jgi:hypothetical protein